MRCARMTSTFWSGHSSAQTRPNLERFSLSNFLRTTVRSVLLGRTGGNVHDSMMDKTHPLHNATLSIELQARLRNAAIFLSGLAQPDLHGGHAGSLYLRAQNLFRPGTPSRHLDGDMKILVKRSYGPHQDRKNKQEEWGGWNGTGSAFSRATSCAGLICYRLPPLSYFCQNFKRDFRVARLRRQSNDPSPMLARNAARPRPPAADGRFGLSQSLHDAHRAADRVND